MNNEFVYISCHGYICPNRINVNVLTPTRMYRVLDYDHISKFDNHIIKYFQTKPSDEFGSKKYIESLVKKTDEIIKNNYRPDTNIFVEKKDTHPFDWHMTTTKYDHKLIFDTNYSRTDYWGVYHVKKSGITDITEAVSSRSIYKNQSNEKYYDKNNTAPVNFYLSDVIEYFKKNDKNVNVVLMTCRSKGIDINEHTITLSDKSSNASNNDDVRHKDELRMCKKKTNRNNSSSSSNSNSNSNRSKRKRSSSSNSNINSNSNSNRNRSKRKRSSSSNSNSNSNRNLSNSSSNSRKKKQKL